MEKKTFYREMTAIALPVTIQSVLQAVLSLIDQVMLSGLGNDKLAGVGLASKFVGLFTVTVAAVVAVAGIMIAQYIGSKSKEGMSDSFFSNLYFAAFLTVFMILLSVTIPKQIIAIYSEDPLTIEQGATYLKIMAIGFLPQTLTLMLAAVLRNVEAAKVSMVASGISVVLNTLLNYLLIFGIGIFPKMGTAGAALATSIARIVEFLIIFIMFMKVKKQKDLCFKIKFVFERSFLKKILEILAPILVCEFLWSLGENVYGIIYGHIGTKECAAMSITYPIQNIVIGALSGVSASAGIMIGNALGGSDHQVAYEKSKQFLKVTISLALVISVMIAVLAKCYVNVFKVDAATRQVAVYILYAYAIVFTAKVINMVLGGGVLRSGGQTKYIMLVDIIGTWCIGVPVGFLTAYVLKLPIYYVYFMISLEEFVRVILCMTLFKSKRWMVNLAAN